MHCNEFYNKNIHTADSLSNIVTPSSIIEKEFLLFTMKIKVISVTYFLNLYLIGSVTILTLYLQNNCLSRDFYTDQKESDQFFIFRIYCLVLL